MWALTGHCAHPFDCNKWQTGCGKCPYLRVYPALWYDITHSLWKIKKDIYKRYDWEDERLEEDVRNLEVSYKKGYQADS